MIDSALTGKSAEAASLTGAELGPDEGLGVVSEDREASPTGIFLCVVTSVKFTAKELFTHSLTFCISSILRKNIYQGKYLLTESETNITEEAGTVARGHSATWKVP